MYVAKLSDNVTIEAGMALYSGEGEQSVGNVVNSAENNNGELLLLVVATEAGVAQGLQLGQPGGSPIELASQPYPLEKP